MAHGSEHRIHRGKFLNRRGCRVGGLLAGSVAGVGLLLTPAARADEFQFSRTPAASDPLTFSWNSGSNWSLVNPASSPRSFPSAAGDAASLAASIQVPTTLMLGSSVTLGALTFDAPQAFTIDAAGGLGDPGGLAFSPSAGNAAITVSATVGSASHEIKTGIALYAPLDVTVSIPGTALTLSGAVDNRGYAVTVGGGANTVLSGGLSGAGGLTKSGGGQLTLSAPTTYGGATNVTNGTLRTNAVNALPAGTAVTVAGGATFNLNNRDQTIGSLSGGGAVTLGTATLTVGGDASPAPFTGTLGGAGGLAKSGAGTLALRGPNDYAGGTAVNHGLLLADATGGSATGTGAVHVNAGGMLAGKGAVGGPVFVHAGGTLSAGDGAATPGTFSTAGQTWFDGAKYVWKLTDATGTAGAAAGWDKLNMTAFAAAAGNATFTLDAVAFAAGAPGAPAHFNAAQSFLWPVAHTDSGVFDTARWALNATDLATRSGTRADQFSLFSSGKDLSIRFTPAPEPSAAALFGVAALGLLRRRTRRAGQQSCHRHSCL